MSQIKREVMEERKIAFYEGITKARYPDLYIQTQDSKRLVLYKISKSDNIQPDRPEAPLTM